MSDWLGVDDDFDAKRSGRDIGSWDNFEGDDGWKGGATGDGDLTEAELRGAVGHECPGGEAPVDVAAQFAERAQGGGVLVGLAREVHVHHRQARRAAA